MTLLPLFKKQSIAFVFKIVSISPISIAFSSANRYVSPSIVSLFFIACSTEATETYTTGEEVYEARCSACHGKEFEGRVGPALDANSSSASMPDSYWVQTITKGKGSMPAQRLTDTEVTMVIEYIRSKH